MADNEVQADDKGTDQGSTIRNHVIGSIGVGLIPMPVVDLVALTGIQLNMLRKLAKSYDIPFSNDKVKNLLGSLIGGGIPVALSTTVASLIKGIPVIGQATGAVTMPILSGATTYAVGKVFTQHFASGGTFLNFNPDEVREYYAQMYKEGEKVATDLNKKDSKK